MPVTELAPTRRPEQRNTLYGRHYIYQGTEYPSVTTILNILRTPALEAWKIRRAYKAGQDSTAGASYHASTVERDRGSSAHRAIAQMIEGDPISEPDGSIGGYLQAAQGFLANAVEAVRECEIPVYGFSRSGLHYAGTADLVADLKSGHRAVIDWKAGKLYYSHEMQIYAYGTAEPVGGWADGKAPEMGVCVGLAPDGTYAFRSFTFTEQLESTWDAVCHAYHYLHDRL